MRPDEAAEALDALDDYARMTIGVDASGARGMLERFIEQSRSMLAAAPTQVPADKPFLCDSCGKAVAEHDQLLRCPTPQAAQVPAGSDAVLRQALDALQGSWRTKEGDAAILALQAALSASPAAPQTDCREPHPPSRHCMCPSCIPSFDDRFEPQTAVKEAGDTDSFDGEEWERLAMALAGEEHDDIHHLIWTGTTIPEPWGEVWQMYEDEARRMIALVREHATPVHASAPQAKINYSVLYIAAVEARWDYDLLCRIVREATSTPATPMEGLTDIQIMDLATKNSYGWRKLSPKGPYGYEIALVRAVEAHHGIAPTAQAKG